MLLVALAVAVAAFAVVTYWLVGGLAPMGPATLTGRVLAGANGAVPVTSGLVHIEVDSGNQSGMTFEVRTDATGGYQFRVQAGTTYTIWATLGTHWGFATGSAVTRTVHSPPSTVVLDLTVPASDIYGTVADGRTGYPIIGASMSIADPTGSWWCCEPTDSNGTYLLWTIATGPFNVSAAASGYSAKSASVPVGSLYASYLQNFQLV